MAEINNQKFYQFLADYNKINGDWKEAADENGDGVIYKSEFNEFMKANWNGNENGELTNDIINKFWKSIDTNRGTGKFKVGTKNHFDMNALDSTEVTNLEKRLEVYVKFDEYVEDNVDIPDILSSTGAQWKADVVEQLSAEVEKYIKAGCEGELNDILTEALPAILNKCTAQYCAVEYQETLKKDVLKDYPDYKVADDKTLQNLIDAYINGINTKDPETGAIIDLDAKVIQDAIKDIIDAYLATAGLGTGDPNDLANLGLTLPQGLNDLQIEVVKKSIKDALASSATSYEGYEEQFNTAVQKFIDAKIKEGGTFDALKAAAEGFWTSEYKTQLDNFVNIDQNYRDVKEGSDFYNALVNEFGKSLADKIAKNDRYISAYKNIINDVLTKINAGEMEMKDVDAYILKEIAANLEKFFTNGLGDMSLTELNTTYDKLIESAKAQNDDDQALKQYREAAIKWCDAVAKKGTALKAAIEEAFGSADYKSVINNMLPGDIQEIMNELKDKVIEIGDPSTWEVSNWGTTIADSVSLNPGSTTTYSFGATIMSGNKAISPDRITYKINNNIAKIENGVLTITVPENDATYSIEIYAYVDGQKIGTPKTITITCKSKGAEDMKNETNILVDGQYVNNLIKNHNHTTLLTGWRTWGEFKGAAKGTINNLITKLKNDLINAGYNAAKVNYAAQTTLNYYNAAIDALTDQQYNSNRYGAAKGYNFSYVDGNGQSKTSSDGYWQSAASSGSDAQFDACANMGLNTTGLQIREEYSGTNTYALYLNTGVMLNKFMNFLNL